MSDPQTLARATLMRTAPGRGSGIGNSRISKGFPKPFQTAALAVALILTGVYLEVARRDSNAFLFQVDRDEFLFRVDSNAFLFEVVGLRGRLPPKTLPGHPAPLERSEPKQ